LQDGGPSDRLVERLASMLLSPRTPQHDEGGARKAKEPAQSSADATTQQPLLSADQSKGRERATEAILLLPLYQMQEAAYFATSLDQSTLDVATCTKKNRAEGVLHASSPNFAHTQV